MKSVVFSLLTVAAACAAPTTPPATEPTAPPGVQSPAPDPPKSEAVARADALIAEMRQREAAQQKLDRENPPPAAPRLEDLVRNLPPPTPATSTMTAASAPMATASAAPAAASAPPAGGKDEAWWKNEMRTAEVQLENDIRRLQEATDQRDAAQRQMSAAVKAGAVVFAQAQEAFNRASADVNRLTADVRNDRAAVERVREDARRAGAPPGWLRWR